MMSMSIVGTDTVRMPVLVASGYLVSQVSMILLVAAMSCQPANGGALPLTGSGA